LGYTLGKRASERMARGEIGDLIERMRAGLPSRRLVQQNWH